MKKLKSLFYIILAFALSAAPVYANIPSEQILDMFDQNGIYYYNPAGNMDGCNSTITKLSGDDTAEKIWNFFIEQGFNDAQTAGLLGNGMAESGLGPTRASNSSYWGLFQWGGGRKDKLFAKIQAAGLGQYLDQSYWASGADKNIPEADFDKILAIELEHTMEEKDLNWQEEIKKADTPEMAAEIFLVLFERAVNGSSEVLYYAPYAGLMYQGTKARRDFAKEFYQKYSGKGVSVQNGGSTEEKGDNITFIGDSITVGSETAIRKQFESLDATDIDARNGRQWKEGLTIAKTMAQTGRLKDTVVFALGTNSANLSKETINEIISIAGNSRTVVFVTNYGVADYTSNNNYFKELAKQYSNIIVADWAATVGQNPSMYLASDQIHPNTAGAELFAKTIWEAINSNTTAGGCSVTGEFKNLVLAYAWPDYHPAQYLERMPAYAEAVTRSQSEGRYVGGSVRGVPGIDCGGFVTVLVQNSNLAPDYNDGRGATGEQEAWVKRHNWTLLNANTSTPIDTSILQAGDVAFSDGHTFIYVGEIEGFNSTIASASYSTDGTSGRAPMAGHESPIKGNGAIVRWYRNTNFNAGETPTTSVSELATGN